MFSQKLDLIFRTLNCSNAEFERQTGFDKTSASRFRTGSRVPKINSVSAGKLVDALYLYADQTGSLGSLCQLCNMSSTEDAVSVKTAVTGWLFQVSETDAIIMKKLFSDIEQRQAKGKNTFKFFGDKLGWVMDLVQISNAKLAKMVLIDPSYISRLRNGVRVPRPGSTLHCDICAALFKRVISQDKLPELSRLADYDTQVFRENHEFAFTEFMKWLCDTSADTSSMAIDSFLEKFDHFAVEKLEKLPPLESIVQDDILMESCTNYVGVTGLRRAVVRFLGTTAKNSGRTLCLYSDAPMDWMVGDRQFTTTWSALMVHVLRRGTKIKIIHNVDRNITEMMAAIESWLPLYMSGLIEPFYLKKSKHSPFSHTVFLSEGHECLFSDHLTGLEDSSIYYYKVTAKELAYKQLEFNTLLHQCNPLIRIFTERSRNDFKFFMNKTFQQSGNIYALLQALPIEAMNRKLLTSILDRNHISQAERNNIFRFYDTTSATFHETLATNDIRAFIFLPAKEVIAGGKVPLNPGGMFSNLNATYTTAEYASHISDLLALVETHANYHVCILPENPFSKTSLMIKGKTATILKSGDPFAAMSFEHPMMINAFIEYLTGLENQYGQSRSEVKKLLSRMGNLTFYI